jgi:hypothetical protein
MNSKLMQPGNKIYLGKLFSGNVHKAVLAIHLYFVKLFGCRIVSANIPLNFYCRKDHYLSNALQDILLNVRKRVLYDHSKNQIC